MDKKKQTQYRIRIEDDQILNHTYAEEDIVWGLVRVGDVEGVKKVLNQPRLKYPLIITHNVKKNEEYMAVSVITILARLAIEAGITSSESFLMSDVYLKKISQCKNIEAIIDVVNDAHIAYTKLVDDYKTIKSVNVYVEDCKKDIIKNLFNPISLSVIAKDLGIQANYLSRLFSQHEGMTVTDFIHSQKIEVAMNMLRYSDKTIAEIADYLHFNSQSYFGRIFKEKTGQTPNNYRTIHHPPEF